MATQPRFVRSRLSEREVQSLRERIADLEAKINTPLTDDWFDGVRLEAAHQQERWGSEHDAGKEALDWFWLIGYLAQKAAMSAINGDRAKAMHHTISTAAALLNWHRQISGEANGMRPGIAPPASGAMTRAAPWLAGAAVVAALCVPAVIGGDWKRRGVVSRVSYQVHRLCGYTGGKPSWTKERLAASQSWTKENAERAAAEFRAKHPDATYRVRKITKR